ncbi:MAG: hypothetical protein ACFFCW_33680 [Candidatus Hodarchaeota archaeon]
MAEHKYNVKFLGLKDSLSETRHKFMQHMPQMFKVSQDQIDKIIAKAPITLGKNLDLDKAELIGRRIESIGGIIKIEIDRQVTIQDSENEQRKTSDPESKFNIFIDEINGDRAKHNVVKCLKNIVNKDYTFVKNKLLKKLPSKIPGDYSCEEAEKIKIELEDFGSRISIKESDTSSSEVLRDTPSRGKQDGMKVKKSSIIICISILVPIIAIFCINHFQLQSKMNEVLRDDPRNSGIEVSVHFGNYINYSVLVYDLRSVSGRNSMGDVFRVFLQFANRVKSKRFGEIKLCFRGNMKFKISGDYFQKLGKEYSSQNPIYTVRTFPENLMNPDGSRAYSGWTGGLFGVLRGQVEDFNDFHRKWYLEEENYLTKEGLSIMEVLGIAIILGLIPASIARGKGRSFAGWWIYGAALFIIALPHALLIKPDQAAIEKRQIDEGMKKCPFCAEMIKVEAKICRYCGREFQCNKFQHSKQLTQEREEHKAEERAVEKEAEPKRNEDAARLWQVKPRAGIKPAELRSGWEREEWVFGGKWVLATILGSAVALTLFYSTGFYKVLHDSLGTSGGNLVGGLILGVIVGMAQWFVLRQQISKAGWWILATAMGRVAGNGLISLGFTALKGLLSYSSASWITQPISGAILGIAQWFVLRQQISKAGWWILATTMGVLISSKILYSGGLRLYRPIIGLFGQILSWSIIGVISGMVLGAITGIALVWLLRNPTSEA